MICCICSSRYSRFFIKEFDSFSRKLRNNTDTLGILALLTGLPRQPSVTYALTMYLQGTVLIRGGGGGDGSRKRDKEPLKILQYMVLMLSPLPTAMTIFKKISLKSENATVNATISVIRTYFLQPMQKPPQCKGILLQKTTTTGRGRAEGSIHYHIFYNLFKTSAR